MGKTLSPDPFLTFAANVLHERLTTLQQALVQVRKEGDIDAVHDARVASRRLRSGLALLEEATGRKKFRRWRRQIRNVTQALGELRDTDVQLLLVNHRLEQPEVAENGQAGLTWVQQRLQRKRKQEYRQVRKDIGRLRRKETLEAMAEAWQKWQEGENTGSAMDPVVRDQARPLVLAHLAETELLNDPLPPAEQTEELHALRLALKRLRYTLEFVAPAFAGQLDGYVTTLKGLQEILGDLHDADVWVTRLPRFLTKQEKRLRRKGTPPEERSQILADLEALLDDRRLHRAELYEQLHEDWQEQEQRGTWTRLRQLLEPEVSKQTEPAVPPALPAETSSPPPAHEDEAPAQNQEKTVERTTTTLTLS